MPPLPCRPGKARSGFTLVELLAVIAIIGFLTAITLSSLSSARDRASSIKCTNTVRQWTQAFLLFTNDNGGTLPTYASSDTAWQDSIAPYLVKLTGYYISYPRYALRMQLHCPNDTSGGWAYGTNRNLLLMYNASAPKTMASLSHLSNLLIIAEANNDGVSNLGNSVYSGIDYTRHKTGSNIGFADGHGEFLNQAAATAKVVLMPN